MTVLRIFGDEAGTMPKDDHGDVFTAATVSTLMQVPTISEQIGHMPQLIEQLDALEAILSIAFLEPNPGYGEAVNKKLEKMCTMARYTRLMTGANADYLTSDGFGLRNWVWVYCMAQSIERTIVRALFRAEIHSIEIILDQKTMPAPTRTLFKKQLSMVPNRVREVLREARNMDYTRATMYESRVKFSSEAISVCWSDEPCASGSEGGLTLAHYLATHYRRGLLRRGSGIMPLLNEAGFNNVAIDLTDLIISPIDKQIIQSWENNTGLREPNL